MTNEITSDIETNITDATTQDIFNQKGVTMVESVTELANLDIWKNRTVYVKDTGIFVYDANNKEWNIFSARDLDATQQINSIEDLRNYKPQRINQIVKLKSYHSGLDPRSGGELYYDGNDTTTTPDNIFIFASNVANGRWKRILTDNRINILYGGITGVGDESDLLNNLLAACANQSTIFNYSRKFEIDGFQMRVNVSKQINLNLTLCNLRNINIISTLPDQEKFNTTTGCGLYVFGTDAWTSSPVSYRRKGQELLQGVSVLSTVTENTCGIYLAPNIQGQFANSNFDQVIVVGFEHSLILSSNCYLLSFYNCSFSGSKAHCISTSSFVGIESAMTNMGENIRFIDSTLSDSKAVAKLDHEMWITFTNCSFDYNGSSTDLTAWFELVGNVTLNLFSCHYEAGNTNAQLGKKLFYTNSALSSVKMIGGTMMFGASCDNDYVFYSDELLNHNFSVENVWVWGAGLAKKAWSNTGMGRFRIHTNSDAAMGDVHAPSIQAPNKSLTLDYNFVKSNLFQKAVDQWWVSDGGDTTRTSSISSSGISCIFTTTTDDSGSTIPCMKCTVKKTNQSLYLLIKRPKMRNANSPAFLMKFKSSKDMPGNIWASVKPVDVFQEIDVSRNIFIPTINISRWDTSVFGFNIQYSSSTSQLSEMRYQTSSRIFKDLETFDHYLVSFDFTLWSGVDLYVTSVECYDMDN